MLTTTMKPPRFVAPPSRDRLVWSVFESPVGELLLIGNGATLVRLGLPEDHRVQRPQDLIRDDGALGEIRIQLEEYFAGSRATFELAIAPSGTAFQLAVWRALCTIPYGATASYGEIARRIGKPKAARAVGMANNRNPVALVVPCHRVIGADGGLVGYGGGLDTKRFLLRLEAFAGAR